MIFFFNRDSRSRTPEIEDQLSDHSNKSDGPLPDPKGICFFTQ